MGKYIDRETLLQFISEALGENAYCDQVLYEKMLQDAKGLPAADVVERRKGKWIHFSRSDECSVCGYDTGKYEAPSRFCPNCGADMR